MYQIESHGSVDEYGITPDDWSTQYVGSDDAANRYPTVEAAEAAITELRTNGDDWAAAEYRIVEIG